MNRSPQADPRMPVLVGVGSCMQRQEDPAQAREPLDLMLEAVRRVLVHRLETVEFCGQNVSIQGDRFANA